MTFNFEAVADILACPECRGELICIGDSLICDSTEHRLQFPVVDGIPRLLLDEATSLSDEEWQQLTKEQKANE